MQQLKPIGFWILITTILIIALGQADGDFIKAAYFVTFLMPVAIGTSYFFNYFLVPKYLLTKKYWKFSVYLLYTLIISVYFELVVLTLSFIVLAEYKYENLNPYSRNLLLLTITIYLIVFVDAFIMLIRQSQQKEAKIQHYHEQQTKNAQQQLVIKVDRKQVLINLDEILYIESLADYVKIHTDDFQHITKEKISHLAKNLPDNFIRIHRSFIVNQFKVTVFGMESLKINEIELPVSRSYKQSLANLLASATSSKP